jgi:hypothetical protein
MSLPLKVESLKHLIETERILSLAYKCRNFMKSETKYERRPNILDTHAQKYKSSCNDFDFYAEGI